MKSALFKKSPCGVWSLIVATPFILGIAIVAIVFLAAFLIKFDYGTTYLIGVIGVFLFIIWFFLVMALSLSGIILSIVSLVRKEERPLIAVLGLMLNGCPIVLTALQLAKKGFF